MDGMFTLRPLVAGLVASAPVWVLIAFGAYAAGRRKPFTIADLFILVTAEAVAIAAAYPTWIMARE